MHESGFSVTDRTYFDEKVVGFKIFFENGYCVSLVFGSGIGSDDLKTVKTDTSCDYFCKNAEVAVLNPNNEIIPFNKDGAIKEHVTPEQIPQIISWAMNR